MMRAATASMILLVLLGIAVPVVDAGDAALAVIGDPVHRVAAEAERRSRVPRGSPQIVRRRPLDAELRADLAHGAVELVDRAAARGRRRRSRWWRRRPARRAVPAPAPAATRDALAPFLVPGQPSAGTGSPGISHQPSTMCSRRMWATSPGRWPVSRIIFSAVPATRPASSNAAQNCGTSVSDKTRSRLLVGLRSTSLQGLAAESSSFIAQEKIADAAAKLIGHDRRLDPGHHRLDVGARDRRRLQLAPARQQVAAHQGVGLLP